MSAEPAGPRRRAGYLGLLADREYTGLLTSKTISLLGDQLARVALTVLVFRRTGSAPLAALAYAVTYLPVVLGGPLLGGLADRVPRRRLLVGADLLRAALFAAMAVPGVPLLLLLGLVLLAGTVGAPWAAARQPLLREVLLDDERYQLGSGLDETLEQSGQVIGFAAAGVLLTAVRPQTALLLDALSFLASAAVVRTTLRERPPAAATAEPASGRRSPLNRLRTGLADARTGWLAALAVGPRRPLLLAWAGLSFAIAPEALATPWASHLHAGTRGVGLLFAAAPLGSVAGLLLLARVGQSLAGRLLLPLAVATLLPLLLCGLDPPLPVALVLIAASGLASSYNLLARVAFVRELGAEHRGRAFAVAAAGITTGQGLAIAVTAGLAAAVSPPVAVALLAAAGLLLVGLVGRNTTVAPPPGGPEADSGLEPPAAAGTPSPPSSAPAGPDLQHPDGRVVDLAPMDPARR